MCFNLRAILTGQGDIIEVNVFSQICESLVECDNINFDCDADAYGADADADIIMIVASASAP